MKKPWVKMCKQLCTLHAERVLEAQEDQIRDVGGVLSLYVQSLKKHLSHTKQLVHKSTLAGDAKLRSWGSVPEVMEKITKLLPDRGTLEMKLMLDRILLIFDLS